MGYLIVEPDCGLHEPVIQVQTNNGVIPISLCNECDTCNNTACYDITKLRKYLDETR